MICEIVCVGTELLMGQITNTNARYLSERMSELGISVYHHTTVGDNVGRVKDAFRQAMERADLVIASGGLGPTEDDLTKEALAECLGLSMKTDAESLEKLKEEARTRGNAADGRGLKQAQFPSGARIMPNRVGTAPGCIVERKGKIVAVLPGPPRELTDMFERQLEPYLAERREDRIVSRFFRIVGVGEPEAQDRLWDLFHLGNPTLALYCGVGELTARVTVRCAPDEEPGQKLDPVGKEIRRRLGGAVYAEGKETSLAEEVRKLLARNGKRLAIAESCSGGLLSAMLTECPGSSQVFLESHVTYSNQAKMRVLGVREETIADCGAVSARCACEMAEGALRVSGADCAVSITGIAGPEGGTAEKPVGTCFIGLADREAVTARGFLFAWKDRAWIRAMCCQNALVMLREKLIEKPTAGGREPQKEKEG